MKFAVAEFLATSAYSGYVPKGPGTAGAAVGVLLVYLLNHFGGLSSWVLFPAALLLLWPSVWATDVIIEVRNMKDPQIVVIDEVLGQMLAYIGSDLHTPWAYLVGFVLFRLFDIFKPPPVRWFESFPGGWGVVLDDVMAGVYALAVMSILRSVFHLPL